MEWLLIVVVMGKRLEQQNTVEALNSDRNVLKRQADSLSSPETDEMRRQGVNEINSWAVQGKKVLYCNWLKAV